MAIEIPTIKNRRSGVRHAAVLSDNIDRRFGDASSGYPRQILHTFCNWQWQSANNYYRLPLECVDCKKCREKSRRRMDWLMGMLEVGLTSVYRTFGEIPFDGLDSEEVEKLVFSDWLDEQGDPRAEWIRIAVELTTFDRSDDPLRRVAMFNRALEIKREIRTCAQQH